MIWRFINSWSTVSRHILLPRNNENVFNNRIKCKSKKWKVIWVIDNHIPIYQTSWPNHCPPCVNSSLTTVEELLFILYGIITPNICSHSYNHWCKTWWLVVKIKIQTCLNLPPHATGICQRPYDVPYWAQNGCGKWWCNTCYSLRFPSNHLNCEEWKEEGTKVIIIFFRKLYMGSLLE